MNARDPKRWFRFTLACLAVLLVTALAANAAATRLKAFHLQTGVGKSGGTVKGVIELSIPAPPGGALVTLDKKFRCGGCGGEIAEPDAVVELPREIFIPTGRNTGVFDISIGKVSVNTTLVVTATLRDQKQTATVQLVE